MLMQKVLLNLNLNSCAIQANHSMRDSLKPSKGPANNIPRSYPKIVTSDVWFQSRLAII